MARPMPTARDIEERKTRAAKIKEFMSDNLFTEVRLAETLGVSRRTVQMMKAGKVTPTRSTLRKWEALLNKYKQNQTATSAA